MVLINKIHIPFKQTDNEKIDHAYEWYDPIWQEWCNQIIG